MRPLTSWTVTTVLALVVGTVAAPPAHAAEPAGQLVAQEPVQGTAGDPQASGLVVTSSRSDSSIERSASRLVGDDASIDGVLRGPGDTRVVSFDEPVPGDVAARASAGLETLPDVSTVEPDYVRSAADAPPVTTDDPFFPLQKNLWDASRPNGGYSTRAPSFWARSTGSPSVRVAVLDTGRVTHPDMTWSAGYDAVDRDSDPTDPGDFHGLHVAGTVAALTGNGTGVAGVAPRTSIVPVRVLDANGNGSDSAIARGILWAAGSPPLGAPANPAPVQVISMSLAGPGACTSTLANAIATARSRGVVVIAAAGNDARDTAGYAPASCPGVIAVGATDDAGARAPFSNFGPTVDISAPGVQVLSTSARRAVGGALELGYAYASGTSMAAPAVAGAAALLSSVGLAGAQIEATLPTMVRPATSPGTPGVLDLGYAVSAAPVVAASRVRTRVSATVTDSRIRKGNRAAVRVRLRSTTSPARPTGRIRVYDGRKLVRTVYVSARRAGRITVTTPRLTRRGVHRLRVVYAGEGTFDGSRSVLRRVRVR